MIAQLQQMRLNHNVVFPKKEYIKLITRLQQDQQHVPLQSELDSVQRIIMGNLQAEPRLESGSKAKYDSCHESIRNPLDTTETNDENTFLTNLEQEGQPDFLTVPIDRSNRHSLNKSPY